MINFKLSGYGWFGLGGIGVRNDGFPGYTNCGWMICTEGWLWHNNKEIKSY